MSRQKDFMNAIPTGNANAIAVPEDIAEGVYALVDIANRRGNDCILECDDGKLYRPDFFDDDDIEKLRTYDKFIPAPCVRYINDIVTQLYGYTIGFSREVNNETDAN